MKNTKEFLRQYRVTIVFFAICVVAYIFAEQPLSYVASEVVGRFCRNILLVLSLLIPVTAGLGLNFSIVVGAMAAQVAMIFVTHWHIGGVGGMALIFAIATPLAILFGWLIGCLFNKTKGQEMITGMIVGFFANGIYQLFFLVLIGTLIPFVDSQMTIVGGVGLRDTITLDDSLKKLIDKAVTLKLNQTVLVLAAIALGIAIWALVKKLRSAKESGDKLSALDYVKPFIGIAALVAAYALLTLNADLAFTSNYVNVPIATLAIAAVIALAASFIMKTKLGQDFRAVGQNRSVAESAGINVNQKRIVAIILSTVVAAWGQIVFTQNTTSFLTYGAHERVGTYAIAAILIGGASIKKATISQAVIGTFLFHTLFVLAPQAGNNLFGDPTYGEYFRVFVAYAVIVFALVMHAVQEAKEQRLEAMKLE